MRQSLNKQPEAQLKGWHALLTSRNLSRAQVAVIIRGGGTVRKGRSILRAEGEGQRGANVPAWGAGAGSTGDGLQSRRSSQ